MDTEKKKVRGARGGKRNEGGRTVHVLGRRVPARGEAGRKAARRCFLLGSAHTSREVIAIFVYFSAASGFLLAFSILAGRRFGSRPAHWPPAMVLADAALRSLGLRAAAAASVHDASDHAPRALVTTGVKYRLSDPDLEADEHMEAYGAAGEPEGSVARGCIRQGGASKVRRAPEWPTEFPTLSSPAPEVDLTKRSALSSRLPPNSTPHGSPTRSGPASTATSASSFPPHRLTPSPPGHPLLPLPFPAATVRCSGTSSGTMHFLSLALPNDDTDFRGRTTPPRDELSVPSSAFVRLKESTGDRLPNSNPSPSKDATGSPDGSGICSPSSTASSAPDGVFPLSPSFGVRHSALIALWPPLVDRLAVPAALALWRAQGECKANDSDEGFCGEVTFVPDLEQNLGTSSSFVAPRTSVSAPMLMRAAPGSATGGDRRLSAACLVPSQRQHRPCYLTLDSLPGDLMVYALSYCTALDLIVLSECSKTLRAAALDDVLWQWVLEGAFGNGWRARARAGVRTRVGLHDTDDERTEQEREQLPSQATAREEGNGAAERSFGGAVVDAVGGAEEAIGDVAGSVEGTVGGVAEEQEDTTASSAAGARVRAIVRLFERCTFVSGGLDASDDEDGEENGKTRVVEIVSSQAQAKQENNAHSDGDSKDASTGQTQRSASRRMYRTYVRLERQRRQDAAEARVAAWTRGGRRHRLAGWSADGDVDVSSESSEGHRTLETLWGWGGHDAGLAPANTSLFELRAPVRMLCDRRDVSGDANEGEVGVPPQAINPLLPSRSRWDQIFEAFPSSRQAMERRRRDVDGVIGATPASWSSDLSFAASLTQTSSPQRLSGDARLPLDAQSGTQHNRAPPSRFPAVSHAAALDESIAGLSLRDPPLSSSIADLGPPSVLQLYNTRREEAGEEEEQMRRRRRARQEEEHTGEE